MKEKQAVLWADSLMRLIICDSLKSEILSRRDFISEISNLYVIKDGSTGNAGYTMLASFPKIEKDFFIIVGHNVEIVKYLLESIDDVYENNIIIISCYLKEMQQLIPGNKNIFISYQNMYNQSETMIGALYGFNFNLTDSEIDLYNSKGDFNQRVENSFTKL